MTRKRNPRLSRQVHCGGCQDVVVKVDKRRVQPIVPQNGASVEFSKSKAPRARCLCGHITIVAEGCL